jgi:hypothetical protein
MPGEVERRKRGHCREQANSGHLALLSGAKIQIAGREKKNKQEAISRGEKVGGRGPEAEPPEWLRLVAAASSAGRRVRTPRRGRRCSLATATWGEGGGGWWATTLRTCQIPQVCPPPPYPSESSERWLDYSEPLQNSGIRLRFRADWFIQCAMIASHASRNPTASPEQSNCLERRRRRKTSRRQESSDVVELCKTAKSTKQRLTSRSGGPARQPPWRRRRDAATSSMASSRC